MESLLLDDDAGGMDLVVDIVEASSPTIEHEDKLDDSDANLMDIVTTGYMPSDEDMLSAIQNTMAHMPGAGPPIVLCNVIDWMEHSTPYACDRTAALEFLHAAGPATAETLLAAIATGVAARIHEELSATKRADMQTTEKMAQLNHMVESMDEDAKGVFKRGVLGHTVSIERKQPESRFEPMYGIIHLDEESTRLHPAVVKELGLGHTLYWVPPRQSWDNDCREFIRACLSQSGRPTARANAFLLFALGHTAYARLVGDETLIRAYVVSPSQDERFTVFQYANRPVFLRRVRNVLAQAEGGDVALRQRLVRLAEATPALETVLDADDKTVIAERLRLLHTTGGMDFTLLLGKWRISLPS